MFWLLGLPAMCMTVGLHLSASVFHVERKRRVGNSEAAPIVSARVIRTVQDLLTFGRLGIRLARYEITTVIAGDRY